MSLLSSVQESQPGNPYYDNATGGGEVGNFTTLAVSGQSTLATVSATTLSVIGTATMQSAVVSAILYSQRQTLSASTPSNIAFTGINVLDGTYTCAVRGADNLSFYSAITSLWGNNATGPGQQLLKIADSSNVQADPSSTLSFTPTNVGGVYTWSPVFTSSVVNSGSNFLCTLSPNFG